MTSNLPTTSKINILRYTKHLRSYSLPFTLVQSMFLHPLFFHYKNNFFQDHFQLVGSKVTELQLTYMDTMWEELTLRKTSLKIVKRPTLSLYSTLLLHKTSNIKFTKTKLLKLLLSALKRPVTGHINNRVQPRYLNSYSNFLHSRNNLNRSSYIQHLQAWFFHTLKKPLSPVYSSTSQSKLKYSRRLKLRDITKKDLRLNIVVTSNKNDVIFSNKNSVNLFLQQQSIKSNRRLNPSPISKPRRSKKSKSKSKSKFNLKLTTKTNTNFVRNRFLDKRILRRYKTHYTRRSTIKARLSTYNPFYKNINKILYKSRLHKSLGTMYEVSLKLSTNYINNLEPSLLINSKSFKSFILRNSGLFILSKLSVQNKFPYKLKSQFKKKLFSFVYPGQSKKNVLLRRKKQVLTRILSNSFRMIKSLDRFSYQLYYQLFNVESYNISKRELHSRPGPHSSSTFDLNLRNIYYSFDYQTKGKDVNDLYIHSEVRIPRVRFKPGYQRIWRQVRSALQVALNVRFQYQKQLTKYLVKFYHLSSQYLLSYSESTLEKIVVYSHLLPDVSTTQLFSMNGFLYLNGNVTNSLNTIIIKNDLVQLVVSLWYYIITRWFLNWTDNRVRKFKRLVYRKNKPLQYRVMKTKKQQSYYTPNWIYQTRYDNSDVKPYLEVDFFTLSSFVLSDTYIQYYHKVDDMPDLRNSTYMLYNWKYIT